MTNPNTDAAARLETARALCREGKFDQGIDLLRKIVAAEPQYAAAHNFLGMALDRTGKPVEALPCFDRAIAADPNFADALANKADALSALGRYREAIKFYDQALGIDPGSTIGWLNRGVALHATREYEKALASLDRALVIEPDNLLALFNRATTLGALNRLDDQATCLRKLLSIQPNNLEALLFLGSTLLRAERAAEAVKEFDKALAQDANLFSALVGRGHALNALDRFEEAIQSYDRAIIVRDNLAELHAGRSLALTKTGRHEESLAAIDRAIALEPESARYHSHRVTVLQSLGRSEELSSTIEKATALSASDPQFHVTRGNALRTAGDIKNARASYMQALKIDSRNVDAIIGLGEIAHEERNIDAIVSFGLEALKTKETSRAKDFFFRRILGMGLVFNTDEFRNVLTKAMNEAWMLPRHLFPFAATLIRNGPAKPLMDAALKNWPKPFSPDKDATGSALRALFQEKLLLATLGQTQFGHADFEKFLTLLRQHFLGMAMNPESIEDFPEEALTFACTLAQQCHFNEYVFRVTPDETKQLEKLIAEIKSDSSRKTPALFRIAILGCYQPLRNFFTAADLRDVPAFKNLVALQIEEPEILARVRSEIPQVTEIDDDVSVAVRSMYEESPYPRWMKLPEVPSVKSAEDDLREQFPSATIQSYGPEGATEVLVAGCGTGWQLPFTTRYPKSSVLAVDLSLSSLSYAKMKMDAAGEKRIRFGHADILKLRSLNRTFDVIFSTGVLHHMKDPEAGWDVLTSMLRSGGFMHIGLYSEFAREQIVEARKLIAERNLPATPENIRAFRQEIGFGEWTPLQKINTITDFFTLNETRDLLFHVQEHRFTIPRIARYLEQNNLAFIGFTLPKETEQAFAKEFPGASLQDLDAWHEFEEKNPDTFVGMYNFWLQKRKPN